MPKSQPPQLINTARVRGRRTLRFACYQDLLDDVRRLASGRVTTLGNWNYSQILQHLALAIDMGTLGSPALAPWPVRVVAPLLKRRFLTRPMSPGFRFPVKFRPHFIGDRDRPVGESLAHLEQAVRRIEQQGPSHPHPVFGRMSAEEWRELMLRHAEMHLSFAIPAAAAGE